MKKDVIYIDIEDDITSIIDKVKNANAKVVALVPPKRTGVLQSVVNLKLLQKAATSSDHRLVLITNDQALSNLAAGVAIPVAKNLQSKPEIAPISAIEIDDEDVINGDDIPVGEYDKKMGAAKTEAEPVQPRKKDPDDDALAVAAAASAASLESKSAAAGKGVTKRPNIPNFNSFRKKLFLFGGLGVFLIGFLVWALVFAPRATVTISAKTSPTNINEAISLVPSAASTDIDAANFKPVVKQIKKSASSNFTATGSKDIGERATGQLTLANSSSSESVVVPAGTTFVASGQQFTSNTDATVPGASVRGGRIVGGTATVGITAAAIGPEYNVGPQTYETNAPVTAAASQATSGGSKQTVKVVAQSDVDAARAKLSEADTNAVKTELKGQFGADALIIDESFTASQANPSVNPAVGAQGDQGSVTVETTYTYIAIERSDMKRYLDDQLNQAIEGRTDQQIYSNGEQSIRFSNFQSADNGNFTVRVNTVGNVGPKINVNALAEQIKGKQFGDIQSQVESIEGVDNISVDFSPFWVSAAPSDTSKIDIKFQVENE